MIKAAKGSINYSCNIQFFEQDIKVVFGNSFYFLFSKNFFFLEYKEKTIFLYFQNQKHVWLVEIKKQFFEIKNKKY